MIQVDFFSYVQRAELKLQAFFRMDEVPFKQDQLNKYFSF